MIKYINRYSDTEEPDDMGGWARIGIYNNIRVSWISRVQTKDKIVFCATCHFPTMQNDTANESKTFKTFKDAKDFVDERWNWFLNEIITKEKVKTQDLPECSCGTFEKPFIIHGEKECSNCGIKLI